MTTSLKLISHKLCPYVQRAVIALKEKGVPFERIDIDLANKPDWFLKLSPLGKVPVLVVTTDEGEVALFESNVICEYIEETQGGAKLHPADPLKRAEHRAWMEFGSRSCESQATAGIQPQVHPREAAPPLCHFVAVVAVAERHAHLLLAMLVRAAR